MNIESCTAADFAQILTDLADFWGSDRTRHLHHPSLVHEFGNTGFVIRTTNDSEADQDTNAGRVVVAYLFGFFSQTKPTAYIHLAAVRASHRGLGLGRQLYGHFARIAQQSECTSIKAITTPTNHDSINFHRALGFELEGDSIVDGVPVMRNYSGPGEDRVVLRRSITSVGLPFHREIKF